jgi:hypothetical protein
MPPPLSPPLAPAAPTMPPRTRTAEGAPRRVGVELEMSGIGLDALARIVARHFGLAVEADGRYERRLTGDAAGDWKVELDFDLLKRMGREERDPDTLRGEIGRSAEEALAHIAVWTPVEIVSPPLPLDRLWEVEDLVPHLRRAGARGTSDALINAFGTQFNPDGVVVSGGHDIDPVLYAEAPEIHPRYDPERDALESAVIDRALARGLPLLGICRGAQLLNVRLGGSLFQELRSRRVHTSNRRTILPLKTLLPRTRQPPPAALLQRARQDQQPAQPGHRPARRGPGRRRARPRRHRPGRRGAGAAVRDGRSMASGVPALQERPR